MVISLRLRYVGLRMLFRRRGNDVFAITQPAHAWLSGQVARNWGNGSFDEPHEELRFATAMHDIGFLSWEMEPTLDTNTGLPHAFTEMPTRLHLQLWRQGIRECTEFSRFIALLVSIHFTNLAKRHETGEPPCDERLRREFIAEQEKLQNDFRRSLSNDPVSALRRERRTIDWDAKSLSIWDWISLLTLMNRDARKAIPDVPASAGECVELMLMRKDPHGEKFALAPWPFANETVEVICEGKRISRRFERESEMRNALAATQPEALLIKFEPT